MKILITGYSMSYLSGQPLYCYELAMELKRQGHEIEVRSNWTAYHGTDGHKLMENLVQAGIGCCDWDSRWLMKDFDLWIASEEESMRIADEIPDVPMMQIVHSEYDIEAPIADRPFAYICIRPSMPQYDIVLLIDVVEHWTKEEGIKTIADIKKYTGAKILISTPRETVMYDQGIYGKDCPTHKSQWLPADFQNAEDFSTICSYIFLI